MVHRLTASEVSLQISVSQHRVYNWEAGRARIPHRFLAPLAEVFSMSTDELEHWLRRGPVRVMPRPGDRNPLRRLRLAAGQSQDQLSRSAGVGLSSLKAWEYGAPPALSAIRGLAQALDLPAQKLALALGLDLPRELVPAAWKPGDLPEVLRVLRLWSRLTQAELASRCGCSAVSVRSWEGGRARPSGRSRERLERLYRLPAGALLWAYPRNPTSASMPAGSLGPARPVRG